MNEKCLVILPTYNEATNLSPLVEEILLVGDLLGEPEIDVLIIDDHSSDGTADMAEDLKMRHRGRVSVLHHLEQLGFGAANLVGFRYAITGGYDPVVQMHADLSHDPSLLPRLLRASRDADLVLGSRYIEGGGVRGRPSWRTFLSRAGSYYASALLGLSVSDVTSGFRCFHTSTLISIGLQNLKPHGYRLQLELTYRCARLGLRIVEVPIMFTERGSGGFKGTGRAAIQALGSVWQLRLAHFSYPSRNRRALRSGIDLSYVVSKERDDAA